MGSKEIEDALSRLDMLTKEECLMMTVRNLEATYHVNDNVQETKALANDIGCNLKATKMLVEDIDDDVKGILGITRNVDKGTQHILSVFMLMSTLFAHCIPT